MTEASLYEHLFPLWKIMRQHVAVNFNGSALDTDRWTTNVSNGGTPAYSMVDAVGEGFEIDSNSDASPKGGFINFNLINQYDEVNCEHIAVWRCVQNTSIITTSGFHGVTSPSTQTVQARADTGQGSDFRLLTGDASVNSATATDTPIDTVFNTWKTKIVSGTATLFLNGVFKVTHSTNLPTVAMEPYFQVNQRASSARQGHIRSYEAWNV